MGVCGGACMCRGNVDVCVYVCGSVCVVCVEICAFLLRSVCGEVSGYVWGVWVWYM